MSEDVVMDRSTLSLELTFRDENQALAIPNAVTYRVQDVGTGTDVVPRTAIPVLTAVLDIVIGSDQNAILNAFAAYEGRVVTIEWDYGTPTKHATQEYRYRIKNLQGVA